MSVPTEKITDERLQGWRVKLSEEHATPILLMAVGHDHKEGQIVICCLEGVADDLICAALWKSLQALGGKKLPQTHGQGASFTCS